MSQSPLPSLTQVCQYLSQYRRRWLVPALACTALAAVYALVAPKMWEASQPLSVREEGSGGVSRPGRFVDTDAMKTAQETVMEIIKSPAVVRAALLDTNDNDSTADWPTDEEVEKAQKRIRIVAPRGAEFGKTEVFYLQVEQRSRSEAIALANALVHHADRRLRHLRNQRAESLINELSRVVLVAEQDLSDATQRLSDIENQVGGDLAELRILNEAAGGESNLRQTLIAIKNDARQAQTAIDRQDQLLELLEKAKHDTTQLLATPNDLLTSQPALRQLKEALIEAQLKTARLLGEMSELHPVVRSSVTAQDEIQQRLNDELDLAIRGLQAENRLFQSQWNTIEQQRQEIEQRIQRVASVRAEYSNLVEAVRHRSLNLQEAEKEFAESRASQAAAKTSGLLLALDQPTTGPHPAGPRKAVVVLAGLFGGLALGIGWLVFTTPLPGWPSPVADTSHGSNGHGQAADIEPAGRSLSLKQALKKLTKAVPSRN